MTNEELISAIKAEYKRDAADQMLEALRNLSNEVRRYLTEMHTVGHSNYGALEQREEEAREAIRAADGSEQ